MAETFYGPWGVEARRIAIPAPNASTVRFIIAGSDAGDGIYTEDLLSEPVTISGEAWTVAMEYRVPNLPTWFPMEVRRTASYTTQDALVVSLRPTPVQSAHVVLMCRSRNPAHSPLHPILNPYDFTVSDEAMKGRRPRPNVRDGGPRHRGAHR